MRIAQIVSTYPPYRGGTGRVAQLYVDGLRARGHEAHLFVPGTPLPEDPPHVHRLPASFSIGNAAWWPTFEASWRTFDLIHLHLPFFGGVESLLWERLCGRSLPKIVVTYHMDATAPGLKGFVFLLYGRYLLPHVLRLASRICVSSIDYAKTSLLSGLPELSARIEAHPFGIDPELFAPVSDRETLKREMGLDRPILLFVGGMDRAHAFKGVTELLKAFACVQEHVPHQLVLVGDGDLQQGFEMLAHTLGLQDRVRFEGGVSDEAVRRWYQVADLLVFPSTSKAEAFGLVVLEAQACGCPAIVSDLPGVRTVIESGRTGWLTPPQQIELLATLLKHVLVDEVRLQEARIQARERVVSHFTDTAMIDRLIATYSSL